MSKYGKITYISQNMAEKHSITIGDLQQIMHGLSIGDLENDL